MASIVLALSLLSAPEQASPYAGTTIDIGVVAKDLERSFAFYRQALGFVPADPASFDVSGDMGRRSGLSDGLPFRVMVLRLPGADEGATKLKLMTFPRVGPAPRGNFIHSAAGVRYLTLFVEDIDAAVARVRKAGVRVLAEGPTAVDPSIARGVWLALVRDPDGNFIELVGPRAEVGFRPLFNGEDLAGWHPFRKGRWEVRDGVIVGEHGANYLGGWLVSDETFGDFELRLRFRITPGANSGVAIRYPGEGSPAKLGYEMQIGDPDPEYPTGSVFGLRAGPKGLLREGAWQEARIVAEGQRITTYIDGRRAAEIERDRSASGHIALQVHTGERYAGIRVEFKDIRIRTR